MSDRHVRGGLEELGGSLVEDVLPIDGICFLLNRLGLFIQLIVKVLIIRNLELTKMKVETSSKKRFQFKT